MNRNRLLRLLVLSSPVLAAGLLPADLSAQPRPALNTAGLDDGSLRNRGGGLADLTDDAVMAELSRRGLESLLARSFDTNKVEESERDAIKTLMALRDLSNPDRALSARRRQEKVKTIVDGIEAALPNMNDPQVLMENAAQLIVFGVERDVNTLEYWGENPKTQAALRPVVETVLKILDKASEAAIASAEQLANQINDPNATALIDKWQRMDDLANNAVYTRHMVDYYLALSMDAADPERQKVIDTSIEFLSQFDNADTQVQPVVKARLGKLNLLKGEHRIAKQMFDAIANKEVSPEPNIGQQFEARYFSILCDLQIPNFEAVDKGINEIIGWYKTNLPEDRGVQDGANAAVSMLKYRRQVVASAQLADEQLKQQAKKMAVQELLDLLKRRPDLQGIIYEQLMAQLPQNLDAEGMKTLDPLLLGALIRKGDQERIKSEDEQPDMALMDRGMVAARELFGRLGQPGVDPQNVEDAALLIGLFHERKNQKLEAGNAFLDYLDKFKTGKNAQIALEYAMSMVAQLRNEGASDAAFTKLYERFLATAINKPFSRTEFSFEYAQQLQRAQEFKNAATYYAMVPPTDKRYTAARYFQLLALKQYLDSTDKIPESERQSTLLDIQKLTDEVSAAAKSALASASTEKDKLNAKSILVRTSLLGAELARTQSKDPARVLMLLEGFDESVEGLPKANDLLAEALQLRVNAYMAIGENNKATEALVKLLEKSGAREGSEMVYKLLMKLEDDLAKARAANDKAAMKTIAQNRAALSGFLVSWAEKHQDASIRQFFYRYSVFDAASKHMAADLEEDRSARRKGREEALARYQSLLDPKMVEMYRNTLKGTNVDPKYPDPQVMLGIGLIQFDLGDYKDAQEKLGKLINDRKLGSATMVVEREGVDIVVDNDQYWDAMLKLLLSNVELAKDGNSQLLEDTKSGLKRLYITWGERTGGKKFHQDFETLRKEILPDFDWKSLTASATTQPA